MLVFTRRKGEVIYIGEDILLQVIEVKAGKVRLGIRVTVIDRRRPGALMKTRNAAGDAVKEILRIQLSEQRMEHSIEELET